MELTNFQSFLQEAWNKAGFTKWTAVQEKAMPLVLEGKDLIVESPTGTGKTLAYILPILEKIQQDNKNIQAVIMAPTRELAMQIHQVIQTFTVGTSISSISLIGGADMKRQLEKLKKHPQMVVGTPNRIKELIQAKKLKMHEVKTIVIDEADQMFQMKLLDMIQDIVKTTLKDRQLLFFSATISAKAEQIGKEMMNEPETIRVSPKDLPESAVDHIYFVCERRDKVDVLRRIVKMNQGKLMAFVQDVNEIEELAAKLQYKGVAAGVLQGSAWKTEREAMMKKFREGSLQLLLTTDLGARGLDIENVTHVIHYDFPEQKEQYIHRSGRTGRMGRKGTVISVITERQEGAIRKMSKELGISIQKKTLHMGQVVEEKPTFERKKKPLKR